MAWKCGRRRFGQEPRGDVEIFVVGLGQVPAPGAGFVERRRNVGNAVAGGKRGPAAGEEGLLF